MLARQMAGVPICQRQSFAALARRAGSNLNFVERDDYVIESCRLGFLGCSIELSDECFQRRLQSWYNLCKQSTCTHERYLLAAPCTQKHATGFAMHEERLGASSVLKMFGTTNFGESVIVKPDGHG